MGLSFTVPDSELSTTLHNRRPEMIDNIFQGTPLLFAQSRFGGTRTVDGGRELVIPLQFAKNSTAGSFKDYDVC